MTRSPQDYIRLSCELHLDVSLKQDDLMPAMKDFLEKEQRLFVWVAVPSTSQSNEAQETETETVVKASCDSLDPSNWGALCFIKQTAASSTSPPEGSSTTLPDAPDSPPESSSQEQPKIQCMTLQPRIYGHEEENQDTSNEEKEKNQPSASSSTTTATLDALQLYTRHCFGPAVRALTQTASGTDDNNSSLAQLSSEAPSATLTEPQEKSLKLLEGLKDKLRELDVVLGQCSRSALSQIPTLHLTVHPHLVQAIAASGISQQSSSGASTSVSVDALPAGALEKYLADDDFLNLLQAGVSQWIVQIRKITILPTTTAFPSVESGSADLEELSFWLQLETALSVQIPQELARPEVEMTLSILRAAKRFLATIALENNTGLEPALHQTSDICHFLRHYPAPSLEAARDWDKIVMAMNACFDHYPKIRSSRYYDLERLLRLVEAMTFALRQRVVAVLRQQQQQQTASSGGDSRTTSTHAGDFIFWEFTRYESAVRFPTQDIWVQFDDRYQEFSEFFLELARKRKLSNKTSPSAVLKKMVLHHKVLQERLDILHDFRANHEKLRTVLHQVFGGGSTASSSATTGADSGSNTTATRDSSLQDMMESLPRKLLGGLDVLDLSPQGKLALERALEEYDRDIDGIEGRLAKLLRDKLSASKDAEEMFRVFSRFNPLLTRTRVRAAVKEFQMQLIATVGAAVQKLQSKFTQKYESSPAAKFSRLRGIPPVAGKIMWAKQMERQVQTLMKRMGDVLGPNWGQQLEGRQLRRSGDELLAKLDARAYFRAWVTQWEKELTSLTTTARMQSYPVIVEPEGREGRLVARVNYEEKNELLFREIRHLKWLGFETDIPRSLSLVSEEALARYPHAMTVKTALRSYAAVRKLVTAELEPLIMPQLQSIRECLAEAFDVKFGTAPKKRRVRWDTKEVSGWVSKLTDQVTKFEERVEQLLRTCDRVDVALVSLENVDYDSAQFNDVLNEIQQAIDEMSLSGYADLASWVKVVDARIADVLSGRLETALQAWCRKFTPAQGEERDEGEEKKSEDQDKNNASLPKIRVPTLTVEIMLRNQEISAVPAVLNVRALFLKALHEFMGIVCSLPRPKSGRFEVFDNQETSDGDEAEKTFDDLILKVTPKYVTEAHGCVERHMKNLAQFVNQWCAYQTLWDTRVSDVVASVGEDIDQWQSLLLEATQARAALDSSAVNEEFGPVVVKYNKVQSQINLKYDSWQKELQASFASILAQHISDSNNRITDAKTKLENVSLDSSSNTNDIVLGVTTIQEIKQKLGPWGKELDKLIASERMLKRQRHHFNSEWIETSVLTGQFEKMEQVLDRRSRSMQQQIPLLQARVVAEDKSISKRLQDVVDSWENDKPLRGNMKPTEALDILNKFEFTMKKANLDHENLINAKDALGLEHAVEGNALSGCLDELLDLKEVWEAMVKPHGKLEEVKDSVFSSAVMRKIRRALDDLLAEMRSLPNRIRQYDAYTSLHDSVKTYISGHGMMSDLKTEALKDRHWKLILQRLGIRITFSEVTIGLLWDKGVLNRKKEMQEILTVAQGEMALEVFLGQVRDRWMKQELELVLFQNRVRLIRGWDDLFSTLDDHMGGLVLMRSSPYYRSVREFQEEGKLWEDRLTKLRAAFDAWVDVQRRWVYLEGILFGSSDIKAQLPAEWSRFKSVDSEFVQLMRRIANRPFAMEALNIENLQRTLERLGNLMGVIQRALGEYLEKQRSDFSRFYFLGDDDLLEIIGNSGEPGKVLGHVSKMFAGLAGARHDTSAELPEDVLTRLDAMVSKDGEIVEFHQPIDVKKHTSVKEWLKLLEERMKNTLALLLEQAVSEDASTTASTASEEGKKTFVEWAKKFPAQIMILATLINWSMAVDRALKEEGDSKEGLSSVQAAVEGKLEVMAETVLLDLPSEARKKFEQLITELVHQRDVTRSLIDDGVNDPDDFRWLYHLRYTYNPAAEKVTEKLRIGLSNAKFFYGFEYLGIGERLVQTPLTDRCYLTLTQALHFRMGGNPFGPAGTGKTESVKALGAQLGRFVLVMNCDETFDFGAMGRLFCGLCQVGAWGCFDEFNRLEERILSAVSQQILTIQRGLLDRQSNIELLGRSIRLHDNVGIFVTMNPGYAGRSNLPDNLKTLFRSVAMVVPDRKLIAQVMLYSQGIVTAEYLAGDIVDLFQKCEFRMSKQSHYDFGLRALKTLLVSAGGLKRAALEGKEEVVGEELAKVEKDVLIMGTCNNVVPKLVAEDLSVFEEILKETFPNSEVTKMEDETLRTEILEICKASDYVAAEGFIQKILQLHQVINMRHGVMLVGPVGGGKSAAISTLMKAMEKVDGTKGDIYIIDPKAMDKDGLYGTLDGTTMEWTDGVFTSLLRRILDNQKGESDRRHWIVFDGDVDPEWAENLNSVLDDNKLLTLPSGERLSIPDNLRIILEVDSLEHATPATVSRCGMIWFSEDTITADMCLHRFIGKLRRADFVGDRSLGEAVPAAQTHFIDAIKPMVISSDRTSSLVADAMEFTLSQTHIMQPTRDRLLESLEALVVQGINLALEYDENHPDFPMSGDHMEKFAKKWLLHSLLWAFSGSAKWDVRKSFGDMLLRTSGISLPPGGESSLSDYRVRVETGEYELWADSVPRMEIESHRVSATDVVITTTDTVRHSDVLGAWLNSRRPLILCGPPGSGKTMTLTSVLQSVQGVVLASLNFSSRTTPEIILKTFAQYCNYVRRGKDVVLEPAESLGAQSWLVVFCDEINLPEEDNYGTQRVIMFLRQLVEQGGFWRDDNIWVKTNRIQFVGACNPPSDAGRVPMSDRFLRHVPLLLVDFPAKDSLLQIYRTFNGGMLKLFPNLRGETDALTEAMVELYIENQSTFKPDMQPQYFYSPRELSRWVRGMYEAVVHIDQGLTREEFVRIWAHEALRLFNDRLVEEEDREWCSNRIDEVARKHFAGVDFDSALARPLFYSSWMSKETKRVDREELKNFLAARLKVFYEEELDVPLVVFDEVLDHILRLDRVLRQPMGHCLLVGDSGAGKTVLSKFVSWMNGLSIFQIKAHSRYGIEDFNEDLRGVMRRVGVEGEKVCFIFDEGNVLGSGFLEAMNALLASGEVPGLFEGDEYNALMSACRDSAARDGVILDSDDELWRRFTSIVQRNLHVVFTMNPSGGEWKNRSTTSPALFNRCVVDWFGTWSAKAMGQVGKEFTLRVDIGDAESVGGTWGIGHGENIMNRVLPAFEGSSTGGLRQAIVAALVEIHRITKNVADDVGAAESSACRTYLSPRDYLALIQNFVTCINERRASVEEEQLHVNAGLEKLRQTQDNVAELKVGLGQKTAELREKEALANKKLQQMVADQNEAEKRKDEAEKMSIEVEKQQVAIAARKEEAQNDLDTAEPALLEAQSSVRSIKKRDLDEVRNLARPPNNVKLTLECVAIMMGEKKYEWSDVRKMLSKPHFIPNILNFDADKLSAKQIRLVQDKYLAGNPELTSESVMRSSKACGPLYKWAESQIIYSSVYNRVQPLREEVEKLETEAQIAKDKKEKIENEVATLESSIAQYKADYANLIRDVETLKAEMKVVTTKVERAQSLLKSLSHESERWAKSSEGFQNILRSLVGDGLLMSAFLTYAGFFDFKTRHILASRWKQTLELLGIDFREDSGMLETLSKASERLEWQSLGLPGDQLSLENGSILDRAIRFPLVIDPSGSAIEFLMNKHAGAKIQKTSFLDKAFMKTLAGAVRFGTALLVENVEAIDPVLNPVLNKEIQRTGGRSLVRIGTEDVDYSPKFSIILTTKNPAVELTPDLCSRVTLVNFTVTPASLQSQSLSRIVKSEKPELETQRANLLKLQGEQNVKLRELEDQMLTKISAVEGSILDDDRVVDGMEVLMKEGAQVEEQISKSAEVMNQVQTAVGKFEPLSQVCRDVFVLLESMRGISFLYEFSSTTFMSILQNVLETKSNDAEETRIDIIKKNLFFEIAARIGRALQVEDKMVFALLLARLYTDDEALLRGLNPINTSELVAKIVEIFGSEFPWEGRALNSLKTITSSELSCSIPLMLCSAPGHDVSGRVEAMSREENKELAGVAMGSEEGFDTAERYIASAAKRGTWVMLKNCHLCTDWLRETLVKKLQSHGPGTHPDFRIFITSEISPKLPTGLLRISDVIVAEAPTGVKASISRFLSSIPMDRLDNPVRNRLYLALAWVHSVVQERLRYIPAGWSEKYEFTEADAIHGLDVIDALVNDAAGGRKQLDPEKLPWDAIRSTLCKGVFGGRITKDSDQNVLDNLVNKVFNTGCFDVSFKLVDVEDAPTLPEGSSLEQIFEWVDTLPDHTPPTWIGLDSEAEAKRKLAIANSVMKKVETVGHLLETGL